ncbi:hypothetical protein BH23ACT9_BH23ACT9_35310 [soil metagenome]
MCRWLRIARRFLPEADTMILVRGFGDADDPTRAFADSLAAGALAANQGWPTLFTASDRLSDASGAYLEETSPTGLVIVGGDAAVSAAVEQQAGEAVPTAEVNRWAGRTRFETAAALASQVGGPGLWDHVVLVDGSAPDAWVSGFSSAAQAAFGDVPVLLSDGQRLPAETFEVGRARNDILTRGMPLVCGPDVGDACAEFEPALRQWHNTELYTVMLPEYVVPGPGDPGGYGSVTLTRDLTRPDELCYAWSYIDDINNPDAPTPPGTAYLTEGPRDEPPGDVVAQLGPSEVTSAEGCLQLGEATVEEIFEGSTEYTVDVRNSEYPGGAIRNSITFRQNYDS